MTIAKRHRHTPEEDEPQDHLCGSEKAGLIIMTSDGETPEHFLLTLDYGWAQTIIARCDYDHHAAGVASAVALALDCDVEWRP